MPREKWMLVQYSRKVIFSHSFSYLPSLLQEFASQHHSPFITSLPYFQILPTFCLFFLKYSLTLQAMQLQAFSHFKDCVFLPSAPSANSSCPFTHLPRMMSGQFSVVSRLGKSREGEVALLFFQYCNLLIFIQETLPNFSPPFLFLILFPSEVYFASQFICKTCLKHSHKRETSSNYWLNLLIMILQILP